MSDTFKEHLEYAKKVVESWPEWKQQSMTKSSTTAQFRCPDDGDEGKAGEEKGNE